MNKTENANVIFKQREFVSYLKMIEIECNYSKWLGSARRARELSPDSPACEGTSAQPCCICFQNLFLATHSLFSLL